MDLKSCRLWLALFAFFSVAELWLLSSHTFLFLQWLGFAVGAIFQSASHMWCSKLLWELSEEDPLCSGHTILEFKVLSSEKKCRHSRWQCQVVPQHHGPPICFTISECRVGVNHLNHSIYTFFGLIVLCDKLCFPLSSIFINYFLVIHHSQEYNSHFVLSDIADYGKPAIECTLCSQNSEAFFRRRISALSYCRVLTIVSQETLWKRYIGEEKIFFFSCVSHWGNHSRSCKEGCVHHRARRSLGHTWLVCLA